MRQGSTSARLDAKVPLITGVVLFVIPIIAGVISQQNAPAGEAGESGWGALILGFFMWPAALIFGLIGMKRLAVNGNDASTPPIIKPAQPAQEAHIVDAWAEQKKQPTESSK